MRGAREECGHGRSVISMFVMLKSVWSNAPIVRSARCLLTKPRPQLGITSPYGPQQRDCSLANELSETVILLCGCVPYRVGRTAVAAALHIKKPRHMQHHLLPIPCLPLSVVAGGPTTAVAAWLLSCRAVSAPLCAQVCVRHDETRTGIEKDTKKQITRMRTYRQEHMQLTQVKI